MTRRAMALAVALLAIAAGTATAVALVRGGSDSGGQVTGSATRLGPRDGEPVARYTARAAAALTALPATGQTYALVALDRYLPPAEVPAALGGTPMVRALARVPLPRVQTAIVQMPARTPADVTGGMAAEAGRLRAAAEGEGDAVAAAVDRAEADRLGAGCACVLGVVVRADRAGLSGLARRPDVRAVEPAPAGEPLARLAFSPLLPEQTARVEPPPDDGAAALVPDDATPSPGARR